MQKMSLQRFFLFFLLHFTFAQYILSCVCIMRINLTIFICCIQCILTKGKRSQFVAIDEDCSDSLQHEYKFKHEFWVTPYRHLRPAPNLSATSFFFFLHTPYIRFVIAFVVTWHLIATTESFVLIIKNYAYIYRRKCYRPVVNIHKTGLLEMGKDL